MPLIVAVVIALFVGCASHLVRGIDDDICALCAALFLRSLVAYSAGFSSLMKEPPKEPPPLPNTGPRFSQLSWFIC